MGGGSWTTDSYNSYMKKVKATGGTFGHSANARRSNNYRPHSDLDPKKVAAKGYIESRDSDEHPYSVPIVIGLDQTGSMGSIPVDLQNKLSGILDLIILRGYVEDPQIAIAAYGDLYCDPENSAVQFSNFESDNRVDKNLNNLTIVGHGGGNGGETMSGIFYMMDKVRSDAWEKRGKKGYAFFVADEISLDLLPEHLKDFTNDGEPVSPLTTRELAKKIQEKWEVFILLIDNYSSKLQGSEKFYKDLFGHQNVLVLEDPEVVPETIAVTIGLREGTLDSMSLDKDLRSIGTSEAAIASTSKAMEKAGLVGGEVSNNIADINPVEKNKTNRL